MRIPYLLLSAIVLGISYVTLRAILTPPAVPTLDHDAWWGPKDQQGKQDTSIRPFKIQFNHEMVEDLKYRIKHPRPLTPPLEGVGFEYGFNTDELQKWLNYWAEGYNFTERERELNKYPHYKTNIQGLDIHFMRIVPKVPPGVDLVPLLLLHGWPGSIREFYETIPYLTSVSGDRNFTLEIVAPSLPGFGFSDPAKRPGLGAAEIAVVLRNLMHRLGHKKFYLQGGDWGGLIANLMTTIFPQEIQGYHTNFPVIANRIAPILLGMFSYFPSFITDLECINRVYPLSKTISFILEETGYLHILATKPDTIGAAMAESPAGSLAFLVEKFSVATNPSYKFLPDGGLGHFSKDQVLDNVMMYWAPNSFTTSGRLYAESLNVRHALMRVDDIPSSVPTWVLQAKHEVFYLPPALLRLRYHQLVGVTVLDEGGHFLALELPEKFAEDVLKAVQEFRTNEEGKMKEEL